MAQFEIRRALPQDVQRITEIYNSNTEFLRIISAGNGSTVILLRGKWRRCGASAFSPVCAVERLPRRMSLYGVRRRGLQHTEKIQGKPKIRRRFSPDFFISPNLLLYTKNILL